MEALPAEAQAAWLDLPVEALTERLREPPWAQMQQFADAIAQTPPLWERVSREYLEPADDEQYGWITVPAVLALAAPRVDLPTRRAMGRFLIECMMGVAEDSDYERELLSEACGRVGQDMLPEVWDLLESLDPQETEGWFHLWGVLDLALYTQDETLRIGTARVARQVLQRAIDGEIKIPFVTPTATLLGMLRDEEARPLIEQLLAKDAEIEKHGVLANMDRRELEHALAFLDGEDQYPIRPQWDKPLRQWFETAWRREADWHRKQPSRPETDLAPGFTGAPRREPVEPKVGRNEPCPCGSGKKYKKCCLGKG